MAAAATRSGARPDLTGFAVAILAHAALLWVLSRERVDEPPDEPAAMEVSFVEEVGPVSSSTVTAAEPTPNFGEEVSPEPASGGEASTPAPVTPPVPEPVRPPVETGERRRPDVTQNRVPVRPSPPPRVAPRQPQPRTPPRPTTRPGPSGPSFADVARRVGGGAPSRTPGPTASAPSAAATGQVRTNIRSIIAAELRNPRCSRQTLPAPEARSIRVTMTVTLARNGSLESTSNVAVSNNDPALRRYEARMRELALALVRCAAPFERLASEFGQYYDSWRRFPYAFPFRS